MYQLRVAVSQFPVSDNPKQNFSYITRHVEYAAARKVDVIHFPETALTGYGIRNDLIDFDFISELQERIRETASRNSVSIIYGSLETRSSRYLPYNVTRVISSTGDQIGLYVKQRLYNSEVNWFSTKTNHLTLNIGSVKCGFLICYDSCFPELFRKYQKLGVKVLFLSYHNASSRKKKNQLDVLMRSQIVTRAADHFMYISGSNSSARYSRMPSCIAFPDGQLRCLTRHKPAVLIYDYPGEPLGWTYGG